MIQRSKTDNHFANSKDGRNNMIEETMAISYILRIFEVVVLILNTSYLVGMLWIIACECIEDFWLNEDFKQYQTKEDLEKYAYIGQSFKGNWLTEYEIYLKPHSQRAITGAYFAFTSLSTVGFGDLSP